MLCLFIFYNIRNCYVQVGSSYQEYFFYNIIHKKEIKSSKKCRLLSFINKSGGFKKRTAGGVNVKRILKIPRNRPFLFTFIGRVEIFKYSF
jgi:hypothetical protein